MKTGDSFRAEFLSGMGVWSGLAAIVVVLGIVVLTVQIGLDPAERKRLPEEALLAGVVLMPRGGPWLGVNVASPEEGARRENRASQGVLVSGVMLGSPAEKAGVRAGDTIERVGKTSVDSPIDLMNAVAACKAGETVRLTINRGGRQRAVYAELATPPLGTLAAAPAEPGAAWLGADVQNLDALLAAHLGYPDKKGIVVGYVYPNSPASAAGIAQGDVIARVGTVQPRNIDQIAALIADRHPGEMLPIVAWRQGSPMEITVQLAALPPPGAQRKPALPDAEVEIEAAWLGLDIVPLSKAEAEELGLPANTLGMEVDGVAEGPGMDAGFQVGDVIIAINGESTPNIAAFKDATEGAIGAVVDVYRTNRHVYISVPPPGGAPDAAASKAQVRQVAFRRWP